MKQVTAFAALILLLAAAPSGDAQSARPKIGLALSGGGAKGCAHVGVLRQLERMHVPVDYVAGTSMGAVVGALYASGMSPDEIEKELTTIDWEEALSDATAFEHLTYRRKEEETRYPSTVEVGLKKGKINLPSGIRTGQKLSFLIARYLLPHLDQHDFSKLPIPYAAVATDLATGDPYVLKEGELAEAVRASMSIPGAFVPVEWNDRILVDGGVAMNVPVDVVRAMGADIVIAIDIAAPLGAPEQVPSMFGVVGQLSGFLTRKNMVPQLANADLVISPDIKGYETLDFSKAAEIVKRGDAEAIAREGDLSRYAIDPAEHTRLVESRRVPRAREIRIDDIRVEGLRFVDEEFVRNQMTTAPGESLDLDKLQKDIEWMYGWGDFIGISAGLDTSQGKTVLVMRVREKPWGPAYIRTGIGAETQYSNPAVFLLLSYTRRWINNRGAEWRTDLELGNEWGISSEFYQPRGYDKVGFLAFGAGYDRSSFRIFQDESAFAQYEVRQLNLRADSGVQLRTAGEIRVGLFARWNDAEAEIGAPGDRTSSTQDVGLRAHLQINTTNAPFFPARGARISWEVLAPLEGLGSDEDVFVSDLRSAFYGSYDRHVFWTGANIHNTFSGTAQIYDQAILGGLANLSGYEYGALVGQTGVVMSLGYRNRVTRIPGLSDGVYAGFLGELGNVGVEDSVVEISGLESSGTIFIGLDTTYGPLMLAAAKSPGREAQYYLQIGRSF